MKVKELIKELEKFSPDMEVMTSYWEECDDGATEVENEIILVKEDVKSYSLTNKRVVFLK